MSRSLHVTELSAPLRVPDFGSFLVFLKFHVLPPAQHLSDGVLHLLDESSGEFGPAS